MLVENTKVVAEITKMQILVKVIWEIMYLLLCS